MHPDALPWVRTWLARQSRPAVLGVSGAQGSGKSTLCRQLAEALAEQGVRTLVLSIDDLYRTRAERQALAREVHPLCAVRGLFGTHDVALGLAVLDALAAAGPDAVTEVPRFDKATDDRRPEPERVVGRPDLVLLEGWCVGARPGPPWTGPINAREARDDPDGTFVRWTEARLAADYLALWARLDGLVLIAVPSFAAVVEGRWRQEQQLAAAAPAGAVGVMSRTEVEAYVALFERKTRQLLAELPALADLVLPAWEG